ncbi:MAG: ABC transporter permease [Bacteroidia bacterium]|nr:MAG: ABC transporter permease [Bacteroidia bacterium]
MKLLIKLAWRNIWRNRRRSLITMSSVLFAVLLAIFFYSMEKGSYERTIDNMVRYSTGYIQIQDVLFEDEPSMDHSMLVDEHINAILEDFHERIDFFVPRINHFVLAASDRITRGAMLMGIDPAPEARMNDISGRISAGSFIKAGDKDIVLAEGLAEILRVNTGDTLVLISQGYQGVSAAGLYRIKGIVNLHIPEMNNSTIYMSLPEAQWFFAAENRLTSLVIMPDNPKHTRQLAADISSRIDSEWYRVLTYEDMLEDLLALMQFDIAGTMVLLAILYIVIGFGLFGTMLTMLLERKKEFAMMMALGMKRLQLATTCFIEAMIISLAGAFAGILVAIPFVIYFYHYPVKLGGNLADAMAGYGFEPILPLSADPFVFVSQALVVLAMSIFIGMYPVYSVFRLDMVKARQQ